MLSFRDSAIEKCQDAFPVPHRELNILRQLEQINDRRHNIQGRGWKISDLRLNMTRPFNDARNTYPALKNF
jgi:hypothetical protein